jgi:hypothetical protein
MTSIFPLIMLAILLGVVAMCFGEGMWSNAVRLINVVTAGLVATSFFEPVARALEGWDEHYTYLWDFVSLWGLFAITLIAMRALTESISRVKVRFLKVADRIGSAALALLIGWVMVCFTMTSLHAACLNCKSFFGGFPTDSETRTLIVGPDYQWLGFVKNLSTGAFSGSSEFPEKQEFMRKYYTRRSEIEENIQKKDSLLK